MQLFSWMSFLLVIGLNIGCRDRDRESHDQSADRPTEIVFKHFRMAKGENLTDLLRKFEMEFPGVTVREETIPASSDQQHQFYVTNLEAGSSDFDLFAVDVIWVQEFSRAGWLEDLTPYFSSTEIDNYFPAPREACTFQGKLFAAPWYLDGGMLYYRRDLLEKYGLKPPEYFEDLVSSAKTVLRGEEDPDLRGFIWQGKQYEGLVCNVLEYLWANGCQVLRGSELDIDGANCVAALEFMRDLVVRYSVSPPMVTSANEEITRHLFGSGKALYMRNWSYAWNLFQEEGSPVRGKIGITSMPRFQGGSSAATLGGWNLGINKHSRKKEAAILLTKYLMRYESQKQLALRSGFKPTRRDVYGDDDLRREQPFIGDVYDILLRARPRPVTPYYLMLSQILQSEFSAALSGIKSSHQALADAKRQLSRILELEIAATR